MKKKKRTIRQNSNIFAMFNQQQLAEFNAAFSIIDHDQDGFIDPSDLKDVLASLGQFPSDAHIEAMVSEAPGAINFTMFLTLFGEKMSGTDPESDILGAFECFDEDGSGWIQVDTMREFLTSMGDRFSDEEVDILFKSRAVKGEMFNYREFCKILKHGE